MRRVIGYLNGAKVWSENEPGQAHVVSRGGSLAVGVSAHTQARIAGKAYKARRKPDPEVAT